MKKIIILSLFCVIGLSLNAQEEKTKSNNVHNIGLHLGATSGIGFSYRYWPSKFGIQFTGIPIYRSNGGHFLSGGLSVLYTIKDNKTVDLYGYLSSHVLSRKKEFFFNGGDGFFGNNGKVETRVYYSMGIGAGIKIDLKVLDLNFQTGYAVYNMSRTAHTGLAGEMGIYFHI